MPQTLTTEQRERLDPIFDAKMRIEDMHPSKTDDVTSFLKAKNLAMKEVKIAINTMAGFEVYEVF